VFLPASIISQNAIGRIQRIVIPFNDPVKLVISSSFFKLSDAKGTPLAIVGSTAIPSLIQRRQRR